MDLQAEKLNLLQQILNTSDLALINDIKSLIKTRNIDWFDELTKSQQNDILEGLYQLDNGNTISHEEVKARFK